MNPTFKCHLVIPQGTLSGPKPQSEIAFKRAGACRIGWQFFLAAAVGALLCTSRVSGDTFVNTGSLGTARQSHTMTLLSNGKVLIAGGFAGAVEHAASSRDRSETHSIETMMRFLKTCLLIIKFSHQSQAG